MRLIKNALPVILTLFLALGSVFTYELPIKADGVFTGKSEENHQSSDTVSDQEIYEPEAEDGDEEVPTDSESKENTSSLPVSADSTAAGKIVKQFISPYAAKLSYNNVYMKNSSGVTVNIKDELSKAIGFKIEKSPEPQVLIMHTHATECFMNEERDYYTSSDPARTTDNSKNITHIGEIVAARLKSAGIGVVQDKTQHDYPAYSGSYSRSEVTVKEYLKKYPSIKIVLDIHRDSISLSGGDRSRPVKEIGGRNAAQVMLCMGSETGAVKGHPNWKENLKLALRFQQTMEVMYPGLARPLVLASKLYNQHLTTGSMLIEVGTESNLLSEAEYSAELVGDALAGFLNTLE